jgi:hypothetical protein
MPLAAIVNEKIFAAYGGPSPYIKSMSDIERFLRPIDICLNPDLYPI